MDWNTWQWVAYYAASYLTGVAYLIIPHVLLHHLIMPPGERFLFRSFIGLCGAHHFLHPPAMQFGFFYPLLALEVLLAAVSLLTAKVLRDAES